MGKIKSTKGWLYQTLLLPSQSWLPSHGTHIQRTAGSFSVTLDIATIITLIIRFRHCCAVYRFSVSSAFRLFLQPRILIFKCAVQATVKQIAYKPSEESTQKKKKSPFTLSWLAVKPTLAAVRRRRADPSVLVQRVCRFITRTQILNLAHQGNW